MRCSRRKGRRRGENAGALFSVGRTEKGDGATVRPESPVRLRAARRVRGGGPELVLRGTGKGTYRHDYTTWSALKSCAR